MSDTTAGTLTVEIDGHDVNLGALLDQLEPHLIEIDNLGKQMGADLGASAAQIVLGLQEVAAAVGLTDEEFLQLAGAASQAAFATGDAAKAEQILALAMNDGAAAAAAAAAAEEAAAAATAAEAAEAAKATAATIDMAAAFKEARSAASLLSSGLGALMALKVVASLTEDGAAALQTEGRFKQLAEAAGTTGPALLAALKSASGGEISDLNLQLEASKAEFLGVAKNANDFSILMAIARNNAQSMGLTAQDAFDKLIDGLDKGSARALKQVGLDVNLKDAEAAYAASIGKTVAQLDATEKKQALVTAAVREGQRQLKDTGGAAADAAVAYQQFDTAIDNAKTKVGELLALNFQKPVGEIAEVVSAVSQATEAYNKWSAANKTLADVLGFIGNPLGAITGYIYEDAKALGEWLGILQKVSPTAAASSAATQTYTGDLQNNTSATDAATQASQAAAIAFTAELEKKQQNALTTQKLNEVQAALAALGPQVASGLTIAGEAAMQLSSKYGIAYAEALKLINAQAQLANVGATLLAGQEANTRKLGGLNIGAPGITSGQNNSVDAVVQLQKEAELAKQAQRDQILAVGTHQQQLALRRQEYEEAVKLHGADSKAAIDAQTALIKEEQEKQRTGRGGGTKLSDQTKLQNSLLASQESYQQKSEDAATQHAIEVEKIQADFNEKMKAAQRSFQQASLDDDLSFYSSLAGITDHGLQAAMSAKYEAAAEKSRQIAKEKGADAAQAYLAAAQKAIQDEGKLQDEINKASDKKNKQNYDPAKAEYLKGLLALQQKDDAERLKQIEENGSAIANARDKQLADAQTKEQDAQDKIALAAERAADRKITAADRAGKKIDEEQLKAQKLADTYDRIAPSGSGSSAPAATHGAAAAAGAGQGESLTDALHKAQDAIVAAVQAVEAATKRGASDVASAVRSAERFAH